MPNFCCRNNSQSRMPAHGLQVCCAPSQLEGVDTHDPRGERPRRPQAGTAVKDQPVQESWRRERLIETQHRQHFTAFNSFVFKLLPMALCYGSQKPEPQENFQQRGICDRPRCLLKHLKSWDRKLGTGLQNQPQDQFALNCSIQCFELRLHPTAPAPRPPTKQEWKQKTRLWGWTM